MPLKCDGTCAEIRFRLSAKRTSPLKSAGASVHSNTGSRGVRISGTNAGYTMFRGSVKGTGYLLYGISAEIRFRLSAKQTSPLKSAGASVHSTIGSRGVRNSGTNAGYTMFRGSVKGTGYLLHGTRAEIRFRLSAKRTSPLKSAGA